MGLDKLREKLLELPKEELMEIAKAVADLGEHEARSRAQGYVPNGKCEEFIKIAGSGKTFKQKELT